MEKLTTYLKGLYRDGAWIWTVVLLVVIAVFFGGMLGRVNAFVRSKVPGLPGGSSAS